MKPVKMKAVIFAGGVGTRMWPLSRKNTPKQFEKIIDDQSTLQLTVAHLRPEFAYENIYISTNRKYREIIRRQLPKIPAKNIIAEPERRDLAPAVGYLCAILAKENPDQAFVILWSDHIRKKVNNFKKALFAGQKLIQENPRRFVFMGEKPGFANQNLGWIKTGRKLTAIGSLPVFEFKTWHYRPSLALARQYFTDKSWFWNPGYWVVTPRFALEQYQKFMKSMYRQLMKLQESYGSAKHQKELNAIYPQMEKISFDDAILAKVEPEKAVVLGCDLGWADVGTWEAFKEFLQKNSRENLIKGNVHLHNCQDMMIYNYTSQLITGINLKGMVVVATGDVILICPEKAMKEIKKVVQEFQGTKKEKYT